MRTTILALALFALACAPQEEAEEEPLCDAALDGDFDGVDDCTELELGTDPALADSDDDGVDDGEEVDCVSDPLDPEEVCFKCGWEHNDPGDLETTGKKVGDVIANIDFVDQCGEEVALWDFAQEYHILFMTAVWCGACQAEAVELEERGHEFRDETGIDYSLVIALFQGASGGEPVPEEADEYAKAIDVKRRIPVLSDLAIKTIDRTPYDGGTLPGICLLSPEMVMLECWEGEGESEKALEMIVDLEG